MTKKQAIIIYSWLVVLTLLEVGIVWMGVSKTVGAILMAGTTLAKISMIGIYFMHIKDDAPAAWLLPAIPVALAILFVAALFPDLVFHLPLQYK